MGKIIIGKVSPITPVENGRISSSEQLTIFASSLHIAFALERPVLPVPALALPELIKQYKGLVLVKLFFDIFTGAAQKIFLVKAVVTILSLQISISAKSSRFLS